MLRPQAQSPFLNSVFLFLPACWRWTACTPGYAQRDAQTWAVAAGSVS